MAGDSTEPFEESPEPESDLDPRIQVSNLLLLDRVTRKTIIQALSP